MKQLTHITKNLFATLLWATITVVMLYHFFPKAYAVAAYGSGLLPVTQRIKEAAPSLYFAYQEHLLEKAEEMLTDKRHQLSATRRRVQKKLAEYQEKIRKIDTLLGEARAIYQANPNASTFLFIGKRYAAGEFDAQVLALAGQKKASEEAVAKLDRARTEIDKTWVAIAKKDSQLTADKTRLATARILYETENLLGDLRIDIDVVDVAQATEYALRTADELLEAADSLETPGMNVGQSGQQGLSAEALAILGVQQG